MAPGRNVPRSTHEAVKFRLWQKLYLSFYLKLYFWLYYSRLYMKLFLKLHSMIILLRTTSSLGLSSSAPRPVETRTLGYKWSGIQGFTWNCGVDYNPVSIEERTDDDDDLYEAGCVTEWIDTINIYCHASSKVTVWRPTVIHCLMDVLY